MDASLDIDGALQRVAERHGTPSYVYFAQAIEARIDKLHAAFGGRFALSYAVKSNPNPALLAWLNGRVELLDVSSIGEFVLGVRAGWEPARLSFTGPGKRDFELRQAIEGGVGELIVESVREAVAADRIAAELGRVQNILIRIAPTRVPKGFGDHMAGRPCAFGVDQEDIGVDLPKILSLAHLRCVGLHIYSGTQCLKPAAIVENYGNFLAIFREVCDRYDLTPDKLVLGSGLGIPYHDEDSALDLDEVAGGIVADLDAFKREPRFAGTQLVLELGRYLVGEAGYFLTRVVSVKQSRGSRIGICDGGMNNHLPASGNFGMVVPRNYSMHKVGGSGPDEKVDLVGPLCTSIDRLARGRVMPRIEEGDLIAVHNSGSYGLTASPVHFISHGLPREIFVDAQGPRDVTRFDAGT
jgi:diaminopimelate decarboxylase